jgi:hypothetical protein
LTARTATLAAIAAVAIPLADSSAQRLEHARKLPAARGDEAPAAVFGDSRNYFGERKDTTTRATPWAVLASTIVPGTGQAWLGQDRFVAYLAVEAYAWARYIADAREGRQARSSYRNLASEVARRPFSATRPIGDFDYYERMEKFVESGAFDAIAGGDLDPDPDTTTANGAIWLLARQTFWSNPSVAPPRDSTEYKFAEEFYRERAVGPDYRWSWTNAQLEYAEFRRTIHRSNNAYRNSLEDLGLVIANHALSTVDAFITVRLRRQVNADGKRFELTGSLPFGRGRWPK